MNVKMARGKSAQVVLLPDGVVGEALLERMTLWAGEGLIDPVFWVPAAKVLEHEHMPADITAIVIGRDTEGTLERREMPLLSALGNESITELIVTSVRCLTSHENDRDIQSGAAGRLLEALKDAMPLSRQVGDAQVGGTSVRSLNLVFAATRVLSGELAGLLSSDWEENIVVSPEDRPRPNSADRFTDAENVDKWASFVAASVSTIAGLWAGYSSTLVTRAAGSGMASKHPKVRVARTFARGVVSGDFSVELAREVAAALRNPKSPLTDPVIASNVQGISALGGEEAERVIARAVEHLLASDSGILSYQGLSAVPEPEPDRVSFKKSISGFFSFSLNKLGSLPVWIMEWFAEKVSRKTKGTLYGADSPIDVDTRVDIGISNADQDIAEISGAISEIRMKVLAALDQAPLPITKVSAPTLWAELRATLFTLVDGGSTSDGMKPILVGDEIGLIPDVGMVIPAPWEKWKLPADAALQLTGRDDSETTATWTEPSAARELRDHLSERTRDLEVRVQELEQRYATSRTALITTERDFVEARQLWEDLSTELDELKESRELDLVLSRAPYEMQRNPKFNLDDPRGEGHELDAPYLYRRISAVDGENESAQDLECELPDEALDSDAAPEKPLDFASESSDFSNEKNLETRVTEQWGLVEHLEKSVAIRSERVSLNRDRVAKIRTDERALSTARDSLATWLQERSESLALRLLDYLDLQEKHLSDDERKIQAWGRSTSLPTEGRARRLRDEFVRGMLVTIGLAVIIPLAAWIFAQVLKSQDLEIYLLGDSWWRYVLLGVVILFVGVLISSAAYHRGYVSMRTELSRQLDRGRYLLSSIGRMRSERARLGGLVPQVRERLEFYGAVLQESWRVPDFQSGGVEANRLEDWLPALLQIASAKEGQGEALRALRNNVTANEIKIGMRRAAVDELLRRAARRRGLSADQADLKVIDRDISAYGVRDALYETVRDADILESLGRAKVARIATAMQGELDQNSQFGNAERLTSRPPVVLINRDELTGFSVKQDLLAEWSDNQQAWDEFLMEIMEDGAALSKFAFSSIGLTHDRHVEFDSIIVAPDRIQIDNSAVGKSVKVVKLDSSVVRNAEIVARLDITPPMDVNEVALFSEAPDNWRTREPSGSRNLGGAEREIVAGQGPDQDGPTL